MHMPCSVHKYALFYVCRSPVVFGGVMFVLYMVTMVSFVDVRITVYLRRLVSRSQTLSSAVLRNRGKGLATTIEYLWRD